MRKNRLKSIYVLLHIAVLFLALLPLSPAASAKDSQGSQIMVSLGDSFSSGESIEDFYGQKENGKDVIPAEKVQNPDWLAHRSQESWPGRLKLPTVSGTMADHRNENWYFVAVSGAKAQNMENNTQCTRNEKDDEKKDPHCKEYKKFVDPISGHYFPMAGNPAFVKVVEGCYHIEPQLNVFDTIEKKFGKNTVDYVTLTLGGNDAGFAKVVEAGVTHGRYWWPNTLPDMIEDTKARFTEPGGIRDKLYEAYKAIAKKAGPQARIIVAGYPKLIDQEGGFPYSKEEAATINNKGVRWFNGEIKKIVDLCKVSGMKICFVPVEGRDDGLGFDGHEAYTKDPWINSVILSKQPEDLKDSGIGSAYSAHPNKKGAAAYAECVQKKIKELEDSNGQSEWPERTTSDERDIVMVLDTSGSMSGTPIEETRKASVNFVNRILKEDASIGVVEFSSEASVVSNFSMNQFALETAVNNAWSGGGTNMDAGLREAHEMLQSSNARKKIIVLMSDGQPNEGRTGQALIDFAAEIKKEGIYIYTLGFFHSLSGGSLVAAQDIMGAIANEGCHYEVDDADNLVFFFGDIADQINGQKYIYVRIACPVNVTVSRNGETLSSSEKDLNTRTAFGSLTFEENKNNEDDKIKILRLKADTEYDIQIAGYARGKMDYTIGFMDEDGKYSDFRRFRGIAVTRSTVVDTVAKSSGETMLNVDEDGDSKYDLKYKAGVNEYGELVDYSYIYYIAIGVVAAVVILVFALRIRKRVKAKRNKS